MCVTVMTSAGREVIAASDLHIQSVEELQFVLGEGPTTDADRTLQPVLISDVAATGVRWLQFAAAARARGVGGVYAVPLQLGGVRLGVWSAYTPSDSRLEPTGISRLLRSADQARDLLLGDHESGGQAQQISQAVRLRVDVYQAQGMLMVALGISLTDALLRLRAMAYAEGLDINELAAELVSGRRPMPRESEGAE